MERTLLLNVTYEPIKVVSWRKAVTLLFLDKVEVIEHYDREIRSISASLRLPAVVRLLKYSRREKGRVKFSRDTIFQRDRYTCQYCLVRLPSHQLTCDHIIPRSRGGQNTWHNVVTACWRCNTKKGDKPLEHAGLSLRAHPREPNWSEVMAFALEAGHAPATWSSYLYVTPRS